MSAGAFLITGLPRSRTAWFAAVANTVTGAICHHEPMERYPTWRDCLDLWRDRDRKWVGISDSALGFHLREILADHKPRTLIVKRDLQQVVGSLEAIGVGGDMHRFCSVLNARMIAAQGHPLVKTVAFEMLSDPAVVRSCLWHLMPGAEIDGDRIEVFQRLNVQADMRQVRKVMVPRAKAGDMPALVGHDVWAELCV